MNSDYEHIRLEKDGRLAWLIIERPKVLNALNEIVLSEIDIALDDVENDENIKVLLITGSGDKSFVAGADIKEIEELDCFSAIPFCKKGQKLFIRIENFPKPVIAVINGFALGGGCELAMACDIRIASDGAKFGQPEVNLGLIPGYGGTQRLPRIVGKGKAMELILTGIVIDANEALRIGLINRIVPHDSLKNEAAALARIMAEKSSVILSLAKRAISSGLEMSIENGCNFESYLFAVSSSTEDKKEGISAFFEKRKPLFCDR